MTQLDNNLNALLPDIQRIIESGKKRAAVAVNSALTLTYWYIGKRINEDILGNERAEYGKQIVSSLAEQLVAGYGKSFESRNLRRMMQFSELFSDIEKVSTLSTQLSWSHFVELLTIKNDEARMFYSNKISTEHWSIRLTRKQIEKKAFELSEIANTKLDLDEKHELIHTFKGPYILDFLELKEGYLEKDLESAILRELELFILELGKGFAFVERQKRMIIDGEDFSLDLLFYHRKLKRLVASDLKLGRFKAAYKGQMELYLSWLNEYERNEEENTPIGLILCTEAGAEQVQLLNLKKDGIVVAEYWTDLPPKELLEQKLHDALIEARERLERRKIK